MPVFGRGFPSKPRPFGVIAAPAFAGEIDTLDNTGTASQTITTAEAQGVNQSGSATTALAAEVTREPNKDNQGTASQNFALDATADTDSNSASDTQTLTDLYGDTVNNSGSSTNALTAEATRETVSNSATASQTLVESVAESLPPGSPYTFTPLLDEFNRSVTDGAGTSDSGFVYTIGGTAANVDITGGSLVFSNAGAPTATSIGGAIGGVGNLSALYRFKITYTQPPSNVLRLWFYFRSNGTTVYRMMNELGGSPPNYRLTNSIVDITQTNLAGDAGYTIIGPPIPDQWFWCRIVVENNNFAYKVWLDGTTEPTSFNSSFTDSLYPPSTTADQFALLASSHHANDSGAKMYVDSVNVTYTPSPPKSTQVITQYDYEIVTNQGGTSGAYGGGAYGGGPYGMGDGQSIVEKIAETVSNSATATIAIDETIITPSVNDVLTNTGTASQTLSTERTSESDNQSGTGTQTFSEATAETISNSATATTRITESQSELESNQGTGSQNTTEAIAETVSNSATATQTLTTERSTETESNTGVGSQTFAEATAETVSNSATATTRITDAPAETESNTGTGSQTITDATAETVSNQGTATHRITELEPEPAMTNVGTGSQNLSEAIAETDSNSATATILISDFQSETEANTGTGAPTIVEKTAETISNSATATIRTVETETDSDSNTGTGTPAISEATAETVDNTGTATLRITDTIPEPSMVNVGTGTQFISEATAETTSNSATSSQTIAEAQPGDTVDNTGTGTHSFSEAIAESVTNTSASSQTMAEATAESDSNSGSGTPTIEVTDLESLLNSGVTVPSTAVEAIAETDFVSQFAQQYLDDSIHFTVVPFGDISTGTWTVPPLYEKIDELAVATGYPTETIRSGNNPSNDKAIIQLAPASDPGIDTEHYINIQFYKDGDETLDFTVNLKEGSTLIATRTYTNVTETAASPKVEKIALTTLEASAIVDYSNLNVELIANQTS